MKTLNMVAGDHQLWFINKTQLAPLGITEQHAYFILGLLGILVCYFFIQPIVRLLVVLQLDRLITYVVGSLLLLLIIGLSGTQVSIGESGSMSTISLGIIFFGVVLLVVHLCQSIISHIKHQKTKSM